jgi:hypothetical protein
MKRYLWVVEMQKNGSIIWRPDNDVSFTKKQAMWVGKCIVSSGYRYRIVKYVPQEKAK